jgi:hypothetical protein
MVGPEQLSTLWKVAHAVFLLSSAAAERVSESEHDDFGYGDALDEQEGAIGAKIRSALSTLLPQSNGNLLVTILMR